MCLDSQDKYINCISLGWYCDTASSCSRLGLRSFSGPFDWILSDFEYVITMIDKEFDGFLLPENLRIDEDNAKCFYDIKNKFYFPHDISNDLNKDLSSIQLKYKKRISNFIEQSKKPTCYFRIVKNMQEIDYIEQNSQYIDSVIKKYNKKNKIIYNCQSKSSYVDMNSRFYNSWKKIKCGSNSYEFDEFFNRFNLTILILFRDYVSYEKFMYIVKYGIDTEYKLLDFVCKPNIDFDSCKKMIQDRKQGHALSEILKDQIN